MAAFVRMRFIAVIALIGGMSACASHDQHAAAAAPTALQKRLNEVLSPGSGTTTHYAARVVDLTTGKEVYCVDADTPYMPASNGKLSVGAATLDFFGPDYTFKTYLAMDGNDLWIIGTGDPGIGDAMIAKKYGGTTMTVLEHWADELRAKGIAHISGNLYYYDRAFDDQWTCPSWSRGYITDWYAAPISGLNFNTNCIDVSVTPTEDGQPVMYKVVPPTQEVKIVNKCMTGKGKPADIERDIDSDTFTLIGATSKKTNLDSKAIRNPGAFFADALRTELAVKGITIDGQTKRADKPLGGAIEPPKEKIVAVNETKIADALNRINKQSQNNFADAFCKLLGKGYLEKQGKTDPGSWPAGYEAVKAFLKKNNIDSSKLVIVDGSGLSREDRVTARLVSDVLATMYKHPYHQTYFDSLGISGTDGTISKRMTDLKGRVHAKTGYIGGVRALSGYVQNEDGHYYAFSFLYNGIKGSVKPVEALQDNACRVLAAWPKAAELPATTQATSKPPSTAASE